MKPGIRGAAFVAGAGVLAAGAGVTTTSSSSLWHAHLSSPHFVLPVWFASQSHLLCEASSSKPCLIARSEPGYRPRWEPMLAQAFASR